MNEIQSAPVTAALSVRHLSKKLSGRRILTDISFDIYPGEIFGFIGPNGSGKTTTIKLILGLLRVDEGDISIYGHDVKTEFRDAMALVGGIIENPEMYKYLTGRQNLLQYSRMYDNISEERVDEVAKFVGLESRINEKISKYSLGMRQRLGLAQAILHRPKLLILDEPTNGLDPQGIHDLRQTLVNLARNEGVAVFVSSHLLLEVEAICDRIGVIDHGMLKALRTMSEIRSGNGANLKEYILAVSDLDKAKEIVDKLNGEFSEESTAKTEETDAQGDEAQKHAIYFNISDGKLRVRLDDGDLQRLLRELLEAGINCYGVTPVESTLEDEYLKITGKYVPGGDGK